MFCLHEKCRLIYDGAVHPELQLMELQRTRVGTESRIRAIPSNVSLIDSYENKRLFRAPSSYTVPISFLEQVLQATQTLASEETGDKPRAAPEIPQQPLFPHSPPDNGLLEVSANGERFSHKHVAHDDLEAAGHE